MSRLILWVVLVFCVNGIYAQSSMPPSDLKDSILLNTGKYIVAHITDTNGFEIEIIKPHSHKHKKADILKENIFAIKFGATGKESILYIYDTLTGNDFTVDEARRFIAGEQDADRGYHALGTSAGAFAIGAASGTIGTFFALAPPFLYAGFMTYKYVKIRHKSVTNMELVKQDAYRMGYALIARKKRTLRAMLWGGIGVVAGTIVHYVIDANTPANDSPI